MIEIQNLKGKSKSDIIDLIMEQKSSSFEIYVPKSTVLFFSTAESIAIDYNKLAFAGHLLKKISVSFQYHEVPPESHESIGFDIEANNTKALASTLLEISFGYDNDEEDEIYQDIEEDPEFWMNADQYLSDVAKGKIKDVACPYFCQTALQYFKEVAKEEE